MIVDNQTEAQVKPTFKTDWTAQEVFDFALNHLLKQNRMSINGGGSCSYRADDGSRCAVGAFIPDELYDQKFERRRVASGELNDVIETLGLLPFVGLLSLLQDLHDHAPVYAPFSVDGVFIPKMMDKIETIAKSHNLQINVGLKKQGA